MTGIPDCSSKHAPRPDRDQAPMCRIVGDTFLSQLPHADHDGPTAVTISTFYLDQFEVTVEQFAAFLTAKGSDRDWCKNGAYWYGFAEGPRCVMWRSQFTTRQVGDQKMERVGNTFRAIPRWARYPVDFVVWDAARQYCEWAGKRLPTALEWDYAIAHDPRTGEDRLYPWGNEDEPRNTVCQLAPCFQGDDYWKLAPVGSMDGRKGRGDGRTIFGVHDMSGSVQELTADCDGVLTCADCVDPRIAKCTRPDHSSGRRVRAHHKLGFQDGGFRCAVSAGH